MSFSIPVSDNPTVLLCAFNKRIVEDFEKSIKTFSPNYRPLTSQQKDFISAVRTNKNVVLEAVAGSGKTYTLLAALHSILPPSQVRKTTTIATMNSLGHRAWARKVGKRLSLNTNKIYSIVRSILSASFPGEAIHTIVKLVNTSRTFGLVPNQFSNAVSRATKTLSPAQFSTELSDLCDLYDLTPTSQEIDLAYSALSQSIVAAFQGEIDFDDQIFMPTFFNGVFDRYQVVIVDEVQDLSATQHAMIHALSGPDSQVIAAGDPHQAIYGWRGALQDSMKAFTKSFSAETLPLSVSFRCPKAVVSEAQKFVPSISSADSAPLGSVRDITLNDLLDNNPDVIICRNNAPLVKLALSLLANGIPCYVLGRDIGKSMVKLVENGPPETPIKEVLKETVIYVQSRILEKPAQEESLMDRLAAMQAIAEHANPPTRAGLVTYIKNLFSDPISETLTLSTIHKAKGLEWNRVIFLDPNLIPSKYARQPWQLQAESNLFYVGVTRARQELLFLTQQG